MFRQLTLIEVSITSNLLNAVLTEALQHFDLINVAGKHNPEGLFMNILQFGSTGIPPKSSAQGASWKEPYLS